MRANRRADDSSFIVNGIQVLFVLFFRFVHYSLPCFYSLSLRNKVKRWFDSHHYHRGRYPKNTLCDSGQFFLFVSISRKVPSLTNFFSLSLVLLFIATAFEGIFTSVSLPGLAFLIPALPLTCFVTHDYSLKLTPTSLLPGVYWNFIPIPTVERLLYISLVACVSLFAFLGYFSYKIARRLLFDVCRNLFISLRFHKYRKLNFFRFITRYHHVI